GRRVSGAHGALRSSGIQRHGRTARSDSTHHRACGPEAGDACLRGIVRTAPGAAAPRPDATGRTGQRAPRGGAGDERAAGTGRAPVVMTPAATVTADRARDARLARRLLFPALAAITVIVGVPLAG